MDGRAANTVEKFFSQYRVRRYKKGQVLILHGDTTDFVYNIVSGRVKQCDTTYRGDEIILSVFKPPTFFPMSLVINKAANLYTYEAETDVELRRAPGHEVIEFLKDHPEVMFDLLGRVYRGLDGVLGRMSHLMMSSAKGRLMYELLTAARRFGERHDDGRIEIAMNESDLAARAGLSRETVSREMRKLEREGYVRLRFGVLTVNNLKLFEEKLSKVT
jgi:CRP/FNR family cyclic AMP-dependent transcriptional regulator